jgi:uncharacterized protein YutE (UPF0331/DUF86 family)
VDPSRTRRYRDKLRFTDEALDDVAAWLEEAASDRKSRRAVYKAFQEACEGVADLVAMAAVDAGITAKDDYLNLEAAEKAGLPLAPILDQLKEATGLRNRLVHEYNGLDDALALEAIGALAPALRQVLAEVEAWLSSRP